MVTVTESGQGIGRWGDTLFSENCFQPLNDKIFDGRTAAGSGDLRPLQNEIGQVNRCLHMAINTGICLSSQTMQRLDTQAMQILP
jgi:hypothetical protein